MYCNTLDDLMINPLFYTLHFRSENTNINANETKTYYLMYIPDSTSSDNITAEELKHYSPVGITRISRSGSVNLRVIDYYYNINTNQMVTRIANESDNNITNSVVYMYIVFSKSIFWNYK